MTPKQEILRLAKQTNNMPILMLAMTILSRKYTIHNGNIAIPNKIKEKTINTFYQYISDESPKKIEQNFINLMNNWKEYKKQFIYPVHLTN